MPNSASSISPWERMAGEPYIWFTRFYTYFRPQGPGRTIEEAFRWHKDEEAPFLKSVRPSQAWYNNAKKWNWRERALAWDEFERSQRMLAEEQARSAANERYASHGKNLQQLGARKLQQLLDGDDTDVLSPDDMRKLIEAGVKIEREALGIPKWVVRIVAMEDDELLREYRNLLAQIGGYRTDGANTGAGPDATDTRSDDF